MIINAFQLFWFGAGLLVGAVLASGIMWWVHLHRVATIFSEQALLQAQTSGEHQLNSHAQQSEINYLKQDLARMQGDAESQITFLQGIQRDANRTREENARLNAELEQQRLRMQEQMGLLQDAKKNLVQEFENTANRIFDDKQQRFNLQSKETLETTLNPLRQQLGDFRKRVDDVYGQETADRNRLVGQITELQKQTQKIGQDAINLTNALKGDSKAQGNWGEVILERLLEESGLQKGREYETQLSLKNESGSRRNPDVVIRLPENKDIIIDAKVSLVDYERYCSAENEMARNQHLRAHIGSMRNHINGLSFKDYENLEGIRTLDFVFIFVPIEAAFMLALQEDSTLFRDAYDKHIILVSPTTLLATLRTVENIWRYEKQNKNAEKIAVQAGGLYDQFVLMLEAFDEVGKAIFRSQEAYDKARNRLKSGRGNLIKKVEDIRVLGAKTKKQLKGELVDAALAEGDQFVLEDIVDDGDLDMIDEAELAFSLSDSGAE